MSRKLPRRDVPAVFTCTQPVLILQWICGQTCMAHGAGGRCSRQTTARSELVPISDALKVDETLVMTRGEENDHRFTGAQNLLTTILLLGSPRNTDQATQPKADNQPGSILNSPRFTNTYSIWLVPRAIIVIRCDERNSLSIPIFACWRGDVTTSQLSLSGW